MSSFGMSSDQKKKCRQYSVEYLIYEFVQTPQSQQQPICILCEKNFSNKALKLLNHFKKVRLDKKDNISAYFQSLRDRMQKQLLACFLIVPNKLLMVYELLTTSLC